MLVAILEFSFWSNYGRGRTVGFFFTNNTISYQIIFLVCEAMVLYESIFFNNSICKPVASLFPLKMLNVFIDFYKFGYSPMNFNTCTDLCNSHHHYQVAEQFPSLQRTSLFYLFLSPNHHPW